MTTVTLLSNSAATDAAWCAVADVSAVAGVLDAEYRLVGGNAVTLLTYAHAVSDRVPERETADADMGASFPVCADPRLVPALQARGYRATAGNRFERVDDSGRRRVIDVLAPSYEGRFTPNQVHGDLVLDETPGLLDALLLPPTEVDVTVTLSDGTGFELHVALPDVRAALVLKALAFRDRLGPKDATDLWRLLEAAAAAGHTADTWRSSTDGRAAAHAMHTLFDPAVRRGAMLGPDRAVTARVRALIQLVVPRPAA